MGNLNSLSENLIQLSNSPEERKVKNPTSNFVEKPNRQLEDEEEDKQSDNSFFHLNFPISSSNLSDVRSISSSPFESSNDYDESNVTVPHVFRWSHDGESVFVTGSFNSWKEKIPLSRSSNEFSAIINLPAGRHQFKFVVDNEWRLNPTLSTMQDKSGSFFNYIDIEDMKNSLDFEDFESISKSSEASSDNYGQTKSTYDDNTNPLPFLPPHLMQVLLNCEAVSLRDPSLLPIPNHVMLNHLYVSSVIDEVMAFGVTHRYRKKCITTVFYKPSYQNFDS